MPRGYPGSTPGVDPGGQGAIARRFKRKKIFVTPGHRDTGTPDGWTDRRDSRNSYVDLRRKFPSNMIITYHTYPEI